MRTTLDIDDDVLQAAKALGEAEGKTAGRMLSDLARKALTTPTRASEPVGANGLVLRNGFYVRPGEGGSAIVTNELIDRLTEEADFEDAGLRNDK